jgi:hypothetical protein
LSDDNEKRQWNRQGGESAALRNSPGFYRAPGTGSLSADLRNADPIGLAKNNMGSKSGVDDGSGRAMWAGMIGPILFVAVFMVEGRLRMGYDSLAMYVSALSLGPRGWVQILNFIVFGLLLFAFARGVTARLSSVGTPSRGGPALLTIIALGYLVSGPFVMDPVGTPRNLMSIHGTVHGIMGGIVFPLMPVSCFAFARRFRRSPNWRGLQRCSLAAGATTAIAVVVLTFATKVIPTQNIFNRWLGLIQRAAIVPYMAWLFIFALTFHRKILRVHTSAI